MNFVLLFSTGTLSDGMIGMPRQVMNCAPNRLTTTGGTPRRVASRPNAATPSGGGGGAAGQVNEGRPTRPPPPGRHAATGGLATECGNTQRVGQEEAGRLPDLGDQRVEIIGRGRTTQRLDGLLGSRLRQQSVLGAVDQLEFLAFLNR